MIKKEDVYKIGKLGKPHGVKGEVSMMFTDDIFDRVEADYLILLIDGILVPFFMEEYRFRNDEQVLMKFVDIDTEAKARELTGCEVYFPREQADRHEGEASWAGHARGRDHHQYFIRSRDSRWPRSLDSCLRRTDRTGRQGRASDSCPCARRHSRTLKRTIYTLFY